MGLVDIRIQLGNPTWPMFGWSAVVGLVAAPVFVTVGKAGLDVTGWFPGSPQGAVFLLLLPTVLPFIVAELDGSIFASWVVTLPYFVHATQELACYSGGGLCVPPGLLNALLVGLIPMLLAGTFGFSISKTAERWEINSAWTKVAYFVGAVLLVGMVGLLLYGVVPQK